MGALKRVGVLVAYGFIWVLCKITGKPFPKEFG
jgi:hypothetical protein